MPAVSRRIFRNFSARLLNENRRRIRVHRESQKAYPNRRPRSLRRSMLRPNSVPWSILVADFNFTIAALNKYGFFTFANLRGFRLYGASKVRITASF